MLELVRLFGIVWEMDEDEGKIELPDTMEIPISDILNYAPGYDDDDALIEWVLEHASDETGYLISDCRAEIVREL